MSFDLGRVRTRVVWLLVLPFLFLARPTPLLLLAGGILMALGIGIRIWSAGYIKKNEELVTSGPYAHTRNPLYLGSFLLGLGVCVAGGRIDFLLLFLLFFFLAYDRTIRREEKVLGEFFGEAYRAYVERVPRFFPRLRPYRSDRGDSGFRLRLFLLNQEWKAVAGVVGGFALLGMRMLLG